MSNYTLHKISKGFIITSDEVIKDGDTVIYPIKTTIPVQYLGGDLIGSEIKVIAQQEQIDFTELDETDLKKIGCFDLGTLWFNFRCENPNSVGALQTQYESFKWLFEKTQESLSEVKFTLEDIEKAMIEGLTIEKFWERCVQSLSESKSWEVELDMEGCTASALIGGYIPKPKLTYDKIKILKLL